MNLSLGDFPFVGNGENRGGGGNGRVPVAFPQLYDKVAWRLVVYTALELPLCNKRGKADDVTNKGYLAKNWLCVFWLISLFICNKLYMKSTF